MGAWANTATGMALLEWPQDTGLCTWRVQAMLSSPAAAPFLERIEAWVNKLTSMQDIFDAWMVAQSKWMYLGLCMALRRLQNRCLRSGEGAVLQWQLS